MTDKIQKIRKGIERLKSQLIKGACASQIAMGTRCKEEAYNEVLAILDSMQEEHVSESINFEQELYKAFGKVKDFTLCMRIAKRFYDIGKKSRETVSEGLEEAAFDYAEACKYEGVEKLLCVEHFKDGAKWQKEKDESITEDLGEYINELSKQFPEVSFAKLSRIAVRVAKWQEEKMMAKAADATIGLPYENKDGGYTHLIDVSRPLPVGDNKIAIIFEED